MDVIFCNCIVQIFKNSSLVSIRPARHLKSSLRPLIKFFKLILLYIYLHFLNNRIPRLELIYFILASKTTRKTCSKM